MCSEQTRLSRFVIEGHQDSKRPVCVHSRDSAQALESSVRLAVYVTMCVCGLNHLTDCSLENEYIVFTVNAHVCLSV